MTDATDIGARLRDPARGWHPDQIEAADEIDRLRAELAEAKAGSAASLDLVSRVRIALGDNGRRMQPELIEWCKTVVKNDARYRWLTDGHAYFIDEQGLGYNTPSHVIDAAIDAEMAKE